MEDTIFSKILKLTLFILTLLTFYFSVSFENIASQFKKDLRTTVLVMNSLKKERERIQEFNSTLKKGVVAPSFSLIDENQNLIKLKDYIGKRVLLIFSSIENCPNCDNLYKIVERVKVKHPDIEVLFLQFESSPTKNYDFKHKNKIQFKMLSSTINELDSYHIDFLPTCVLIDPNGKIMNTFRKNNENDFLKVIDSEKSL